jgi:cytoskeletal protein RodZ
VPAERARRTIRLVLAWVVAATVAVAVASWGVALVGRSVTEDRPAALASAEVEERLSEVAATVPSASSTTTAPPVAETPTTVAGPDGSTGTVPVTTTPGPAPTTTIAPARTPPPPATVAPAAPAQAAETRTYTLVGGTASLRFEPTGVTVVFANPAQGFDVEIEPEHGNGVRVEFESDDHESRLDGWWDGGPQDRKEERPGDG